MSNDPTTPGAGPPELEGPDGASREALREFTDTCNALVERIRGVSEQVQEELATVAGRTDFLMAKARRVRIGIRVLYGLAGLVIAAAIGLGVIAHNMAATQTGLKASDKLQTEQALCPLYGLFIQADTPQARERSAQQGTDPALRAQQFETIRDSYRALGCMPLLTPEGTVPPPTSP